MQQNSISPLQQLITARIQREDAITFVDYMQMALYEPMYGYYTSGTNRIGWEGDFYTSNDVGAFFAHSVASQLQSFWQMIQSPIPFTVIEQGAGRGALARQIAAWVETRHPDLHAALRYHTVDMNTGQDALSTLLTNTNGDMVTPDIIFSNELVDAFPVHIVEKRGDRLYEVYVTLQDGRLCEVLAEPSSSEVAQYLDTYKIRWSRFADGWRAEINLAALEWIRHAAQLLNSRDPKRHRRRFLMTIDYGEKARALYSRYRRKGTLACYYRHQLTGQPLLRPGEQDITAHVNFSALINEGHKQGLRLHAYVTQKEWLEAMGIHEELTQMRQRDFTILDTDRASNEGQTALFKWYNLSNRVSALTDPAGMGNFKVLILRQ